MEDPRRGSSVPPGAAEIPAPSFPVTPPQACTALWYKRRRGDTGLCGALAGCPLSHGCRRASSPKGGAKSRLPLRGRCHAFGMTERARRWLAPQLSGSRLLGAPPKACAKPSLASPFGGGAPVGGGEGSVKPPSRCATGREKRCAVSLASLWLTPTKVKVETFL